MSKLVFLEPNDLSETPFTTSKIIAEHGKVSHHAVTRLIQQHESSLSIFGKVRFKNEALPSGQSEKIYELNEQQSTLLITFMKNTKPVVEFKKNLVMQFFIMQKELMSRKVTRQVGKQAREALTNSIQGLPESPHKFRKYGQYTDMIYKIVFSKNAKQLRGQFGLPRNADLRNRFTSFELERVDKLEQQVSVLVELGHDYHGIKEELNKKYLTPV